MKYSYEIDALGDSAISISFGNIIDESLNDIVMQLHDFCRKNPFEGMIETMPAYASFTVFYDIFQVKKVAKAQQTAFEYVKEYLENCIKNLSNEVEKEKKLVKIPVVYDGEDLAYVAQYHHLSIEEVIQYHTAPTYRVFMMGFLPGFAYMGGLNPILATPRKEKPRLKVMAGSVGIAGNQTGIYPTESPGGWQLIGRTNVVLYTPNSEPITYLQAGDLVKFEAINL